MSNQPFNADAYVRPNPDRDTRDLTMLATGFLRLTHCPGGRFTVEGYVCMHCGTDYTDSDNEGFCGQPVKDDGYTTFDATVARRIMRGSMDKYGETE
jgi:hypothetical protein